MSDAGETLGHDLAVAMFVDELATAKHRLDIAMRDYLVALADAGRDPRARDNAAAKLTELRAAAIIFNDTIKE